MFDKKCFTTDVEIHIVYPSFKSLILLGMLLRWYQWDAINNNVDEKWWTWEFGKKIKHDERKLKC